MVSTQTRPAIAATLPDDGLAQRRWSVARLLLRYVPQGRMPASGFLAVYFVLLFAVPSRLVVRQIGAAGTPATLWGLLLLFWWVCVAVGGRNPRFISPVRLAMGLFVLAVLASYAAAMTRGWYAPADVRQATDDLYDFVPPTQDQVRVVMMKAADRGLLSFFGWVGVTLVAADGLKTWRDVERCVVWLTNLAAIVAAVGILQYFTGLDIAPFFKIPGLSAAWRVRRRVRPLGPATGPCHRDPPDRVWGCDGCAVAHVSAPIALRQADGSRLDSHCCRGPRRGVVRFSLGDPGRGHRGRQ